MAGLLDATDITNWFLYGQATKPANLIDESLIRPLDATSSTTQDVATFMSDGAGRFAIGSLFNLVQNFFATDPSGAYSFNLPPGTYTKAQLASQWGISYYGLVLRQQQLDDGRGDYGERAYIWNSGEFKISDDAQFVVDANGNRTIQNFSVVPTKPDNFDFTSNDFFAGNFGALVRGIATLNVSTPLTGISQVGALVGSVSADIIARCTCAHAGCNRRSRRSERRRRRSIPRRRFGWARLGDCECQGIRVRPCAVREGVAGYGVENGARSKQSQSCSSAGI